MLFYIHNDIPYEFVRSAAPFVLYNTDMVCFQPVIHLQHIS